MGNAVGACCAWHATHSVDSGARITHPRVYTQTAQLLFIIAEACSLSFLFFFEARRFTAACSCSLRRHAQHGAALLVVVAQMLRVSVHGGAQSRAHEGEAHGERG